MTLEEKSEAIKEYCGSRSCIEVSTGDRCPLHRLDGSCYGDNGLVDYKYRMLVEAGVFSDGEKSEGDNPISGNINDDPVNHAAHYNAGGIECIAAIEASMMSIEYAGFLKGQVLKYLWRYRLKAKPVEDLKKARYYLDRLIQIVEKEGQE